MAYSIGQNLTETGFGLSNIMHLIWESETGFAKPSKPAEEQYDLR